MLNKTCICIHQFWGYKLIIVCMCYKCGGVCVCFHRLMSVWRTWSWRLCRRITLSWWMTSWETSAGWLWMMTVPRSSPKSCRNPTSRYWTHRHPHHPCFVLFGQRVSVLKACIASLAVHRIILSPGDTRVARWNDGWVVFPTVRVVCVLCVFCVCAGYGTNPPAVAALSLPQAISEQNGPWVLGQAPLCAFGSHLMILT